MNAVPLPGACQPSRCKPTDRALVAHIALLCCAGTLLAGAAPPSHADCSDNDALISEDAGGLDQLPSSPSTVNPQYLEFVRAGGAAGAKAMRITYTGSPIGSARFGSNVRLRKPSREASLTYTVRFEKDFQFVRGGKLPGLGPEKPITGGRPVDASGWSVRTVFRSDATLGLYIYHQDMKQPYGSAGTILASRPLALDVDHAVELRVTLNSAPSAFDGSARLFIDGQLTEEARKLRFFSSEPPALISRLLFHTFFGGSDPSYAPRIDGKYATVHAVFDHIKACDMRP